MSSGDMANYPRGKYFDSVPDNMVGRVVGFKYSSRNTTYSGVEDTPGTPNGAMCFARLVKNDSGGAIARNLLCVYDDTSGDCLTNIDGKAGTGVRAAGVVDSWLPSTGVPDQKYFWLFFKGPHTLTTDGNGALASPGLVMSYGSATGKVRAATGDTLAAITSIVGRVITAAAATDALEFEADLNLEG